MTSNETSPETPRPILRPLSPADRQHEENTRRRLADRGLNTIDKQTGLTVYRGTDVLGNIDEENRRTAQAIQEVVSSLESIPGTEQARAKLALLLNELSK